jgi:hypothetical protein
LPLGTVLPPVSVTREGDRKKRVTLALSLGAFDRVADPEAVFADARGWSRYVGVVDNDTDAVAARVDEHGLEGDFDLGDRDKWLALSDLHRATDTPRHVFVGVTDDELAARNTGWEFVPVAEAAEKAGWALEDERDGGAGLLAGVRRRLPDSFRRPFGGR